MRLTGDAGTEDSLNHEEAPLSNELPLDVLDGRYRLIRPISKVTSGGYVLAAEHLFTRKACAIKLIDRHAPERVKARMRREMEALAKVQGPGVVDFRDAGESDGRMFLVLELLEGRTLSGLLAAKGWLGSDQAVRIGVELGTVLSRCHDRGVIHRDIKPANVFVTAGERIELLDFGIAKLVDEPVGAEKLTQENTLLGTPEYMAPEMLLSSPDVDSRADQYALAVVIYECLTGGVPFEGQYGEVLLKVSTSTPRPIREVRSDAPAALEEILSRALRRDRAERFPTMAEFCRALGGIGNATGNSGIFDYRRGPRGERDAPTVADVPRAKLAGKTASRRRHPRAPYVTFARLRLGSENLDGRIEEVSESGFQFVAPRGVADGTTAHVRFALPVSGKIVEVRATCRWSRERRGLAAAGFEFGALPEDAVSELRKYVELMATE